MAKAKTSYSCTSCGTTYPRWQGHCDGCGQWNSIEEDSVPLATLSSSANKNASKASAGKVVSLQEDIREESRLQTGMGELDRVLGGGLVEGSAILIGGDPGIGKSTILLQTSAHLAQKHTVLYISGEESTSQIQLRAKRMGLEQAPIKLTNLANLEMAMATIKQEKPTLIIIDSIQTIYADALDSAPGTVSQVRLAAHELIRTAKETGSIIIFVGHVTKDGNIAGPRVLEHMVDAVLYFEGERSHSFRLIRSFKNRFGATNEIGVFDMGDKGLKEIPNPSALFLDERPEEAPGAVVTPIMNGTRPVLMEVQALVSHSALAQPRRTTLGVDANRVAMISAVLDKHAHMKMANHDIFLNVTGGMKITEPAADLAIAAALVSSMMNKPIPQNTLIFGEIGLSGEVRGVSHAQARINEAISLGFTRVLTPPLAKDIHTKKLTVTTIKNMDDLTAKLFG